MTELLSNRSELPHFWFHEALFKPFDGILSSTSCSEDDQEQVNNEKDNSGVWLYNAARGHFFVEVVRSIAEWMLGNPGDSLNPHLPPPYPSTFSHVFLTVHQASRFIYFTLFTLN